MDDLTDVERRDSFGGTLVSSLTYFNPVESGDEEELVCLISVL